MHHLYQLDFNKRTKTVEIYQKLYKLLTPEKQTISRTIRVKTIS